MTPRIVLATLAAAATLAAPGTHAHYVVHAAFDWHAAWIGRDVRDIDGRWVGKVRDVERGHDGRLLNIVISLGPLPRGGERYVVVPVQHLETERGSLRFLGPRESLVNAP
jgi:hypothetical protein